MRHFLAFAALIIAFVTPVVAQQKSELHASRETAIELLRQEGILYGKTRVDSARWIGDFWLVSLRHSDGKITNWTVDARAENYSYVCKH
jgi:hypothetical protein